MKPSHKIWMTIAILIIAAGGFLTFNRHAISPPKSPVYETYTAELKARDRLPSEKIAWLMKAIDSIFFLESAEYQTRIDSATSTYLTPKGASAYYSLLREWGLPEILQDSTFSFMVDILEEPKAGAVKDFSIPYSDGPYNIGSVLEYEAQVRITLRNGSKTISTTKTALIISIGTVYPNKGYIITDIKNISR